MNKHTLVSTRNINDEAKSFEYAMLNPNASDGGLYAFSSLPTISLKDIANFISLDYKNLCKEIFNRLNLNIESSILDSALSEYDKFESCLESNTPESNQLESSQSGSLDSKSFKSPAPLKEISANLFLLELYHGQSKAFKDMALAPFGVLLSQFAKNQNKQYLVLAATSGDTGPATLQSLANKPNVKVVCLYPNGGTSDVQRLQMTTNNATNCKVFAINGDFDDTQNALKSLLNDESFKQKLSQKGIHLSAANSVNIGRIVFQIVYHIFSYVQLLRMQKIKLGEAIRIIVPSGNFGNILGAFYAKSMGLPIADLIVASNPNNILTEFINTGIYDISNRKLINSKSPAMDILKSSNVERVLFALFGDKRTKELMQNLQENKKYELRDDELSLLQQHFSAFCCDDAQTLQSIKLGFENGILIDPHTAVGYHIANNCLESLDSKPACEKQSVCYPNLNAAQWVNLGAKTKCVLVSTAHWAKFAPSVLNALIGESSEDKNAIEKIRQICKEKSISVELPKQIMELFVKAQIHTEVINKEQIESSILKWLQDF